MNEVSILPSPQQMIKQSVSFNEKTSSQARGLWRVATSLSSAYTKDKIGSIIINEAFDVLGAHNGDISLINDQNSYEIVAQKGYPHNFMKKWAKIPKDTPLLTHHVIKTKKPYYIENESELPNTYQVAKLFLQLSGSHSAALVPLKIRDKIIGILQFTFTNPQKFTRDDKVFMNTLGYQAALAFERVTALDNLKESKDQLEIILKNTADGIVVHNHKGIITFANTVGAQLLGHEQSSSLIGRDLRSVFNTYTITDAHNQPIRLSRLPEYTLSKDKQYSQALVILTHKKTQEKRWLNIKSNAIYDQNGRVSLIISTLQDTTKIQELDQRKDDFISMASHELKTPLTSMKLMIDLLARHVSILKDEKGTQYTEKLQQQTNRLHSLVSDLLDVTRIHRGKIQYNYENFNLKDFVKETVGEQKLTMPNNHIVVKKINDTVIKADKFRIYQVLTNLLSNAAKYSPPESTITVSTAKKNGYVSIHVKDEGVGVPDEHKKQIFDRFYQVQKSGKGSYPGLGMGLYISHEIIKHHGGKIYVENNDGPGSTFSFQLPITKKR